MRRFLYFFPGLGGMNPGMLRDRGLLSRFTNHGGGAGGAGGALIEHGVTAVLEGPEGSGCIVAAGPRPPAYEPGRQRWIQGAKCWVGVEDVEFPPGPEDLARDILVRSYEIPLGDGNVWHAPIVRRWDLDRLEHVPALPTRFVPVAGKSALEKQVQPRFSDVDALATWVFNAFVAETTVSMDELFDKAVKFLAVNYRIGPEEAGLLGLFDESSALLVVKLAADLAKLEAQAQQMKTDGLHYSDPPIEQVD